MKTLVLSVIILGITLGACDVVVETSNGKMTGKQSPRSDRVTRFLGVPYASVATRFEKAVPVQPWQGIFNATDYGPTCYQYSGGNIPLSEDCLTLDIYTPVNLTAMNFDLIPTMVFIHGGAFVAGNSKLQEGSILSDKGDVIIVVIQYRLGPLGFLYTDGKLPSNLGLWDQNMALEWIKDNIRFFGGDNSKVTLFGESAGSISVSCLMMSPYINTSHFQKTIMQSGSILGGERMNLVKDKALPLLATSTNCTDDEGNANMDCLKSVDVEQLFPTQSPLMNFPFWPIIDDDFLPYGAKDLFTAFNSDGEDGIKNLLNRLMQYDVLLGSNRQEGIVFIKGLSLPANVFQEGISESLYTQAIANATVDLFSSNENLTEKLSNQMAEAYTHKAVTTERDGITPDQRRLLSLFDVVGDYYMGIPMAFQSLFHSIAAPGKQSYFYLFDHKPGLPSFLDINANTDWFKFSANHADELWLLFAVDTLSGSSDLEANFSETDFQVASDLIRYWTNFAKSGNPNEGESFDTNRSRQKWLPFEAKNQNYLHLTTQNDYMEKDFGHQKKNFFKCIWLALYNEEDNSDCEMSSRAGSESTILPGTAILTGLIVLNFFW